MQEQKEQPAPVCAFPGCGRWKDSILHECWCADKSACKRDQGADHPFTPSAPIPAPVAPDSPPPGYRVCRSCAAWTRAPMRCKECAVSKARPDRDEYWLMAYGGPDILRPPVATQPEPAKQVIVMAGRQAGKSRALEEMARNAAKPVEAEPVYIGIDWGAARACEQGPSAVASAPAVVRTRWVESCDPLHWLPDADVRR